MKNQPGALPRQASVEAVGSLFFHKTYGLVKQLVLIPDTFKFENASNARTLTTQNQNRIFIATLLTFEFDFLGTFAEYPGF